MLELELKGVSIPALGFGTWQLQDRACREAVAYALEAGYRHIDTAPAYRNETEVGAGLRAAGLAREEVFIATKLPIGRLGFDQVQAAARESLERLAVEYLDLLLIHWPDPRTPLAETFASMMDLRARGLVQHLGVCNFPPRLFVEALELAPIVCNQVEYHPYLGQRKLLAIARAAGVALTAYSPLARGGVRGDPVLAAIGAKHGRTPAQVALRWLIQQPYVCALPKAAAREHIDENLRALDFALDEADMAAIAELDRGERLIDPEWAPDWDAEPDVDDELAVVAPHQAPERAELEAP